MTGDELKAWTEAHGYNLSRLARALEISERMMYHYAAGNWPVPRVVELALATLHRRELARRRRARAP